MMRAMVGRVCNAFSRPLRSTLSSGSGFCRRIFTSKRMLFFATFANCGEFFTREKKIGKSQPEAQKNMFETGSGETGEKGSIKTS